MPQNLEEALLIFESLDLAIAIVDDNNNISYANRGFIKLNPILAIEGQKHTIFEVYPESLTEQIIEILVQLRKDPKVDNKSISYTSRKGHECFDIFSSFKDKRGNKIGIVVKSKEMGASSSAEELVEKKQIEKEIAQAKKDQELQDALKKQENNFYYLSRIIEISKANYAVKILLEQFLDLIVEMLQVESGLIKLIDDQQTFYHAPIVFHGVSDHFIKKISNTLLGDCVCAKAVAQKKLCYSPDITKDKQNRCSHCKEEGFKFVLAIPIVCGEITRGIVQISSYKVKALEEKEITMLEIIGRVISTAFETADLKEVLYKEVISNATILSKTKEPFAIISSEGQIEHASNSLSVMMDIPADKLTQKTITTIFAPQFKNDFISLFASDNFYGKIDDMNYVSETMLFCNEREVPVQVTIHPMSGQGGQHMASLLQIEDLEADAKFQKEIEKRNNEFSALFAMLSYLNEEYDIYSYCKKALAEVSKLVPIVNEQFLVYYFDENSKTLNLVAHEGVPQDFVNSNSTVSSEDYEYKNTIRNKTVFSVNIASTSIWKTIVPLLYRGQVRGLLVVFASKELASGISETQILSIVGNVVGTVMEKQALYDSFGSYSNSLNEHITKITALSEEVEALGTTGNTNNILENICKMILGISSCDKLALTLIGQDNTKYTFSETNGLTFENNIGILPESREEWVLNNSKPIYCDVMSKSERYFNGDELSSEIGSVHLMPVIDNGVICGTLRVESEFQIKREEVLYKLIPLLIHLFITTIKLDGKKGMGSDAQEYHEELQTVKDEISYSSNEMGAAREQIKSLREALEEAQADTEKTRLEVARLKDNLTAEITSKQTDSGSLTQEYKRELIDEENAKALHVLKHLSESISKAIMCESLAEIGNTVNTMASEYFAVPENIDLKNEDLQKFEESLKKLTAAVKNEKENIKTTAVSIICHIARTRAQEITLLKEISNRLSKWL